MLVKSLFRGDFFENGLLGAFVVFAKVFFVEEKVVIEFFLVFDLEPLAFELEFLLPSCQHLFSFDRFVLDFFVLAAFLL